LNSLFSFQLELYFFSNFMNFQSFLWRVYDNFDIKHYKFVNSRINIIMKLQLIQIVIIYGEFCFIFVEI
jgi:hypothetical protein